MSTSNPFDTTGHMSGVQGELHREKRHIAVRILVSLVWFLPIYILINMVVGGLVGAVAGAGTDSYAVGYAAGQAASKDFFQAYGLIVLAVQILGWLSLCALGLLPGTGKFKRL
jgi:hypothetical protein